MLRSGPWPGLAITVMILDPSLEEILSPPKLGLFLLPPSTKEVVRGRLLLIARHFFFTLFPLDPGSTQQQQQQQQQHGKEEENPPQFKSPAAAASIKFLDLRFTAPEVISSQNRAHLERKR